MPRDDGTDAVKRILFEHIGQSKVIPKLMAERRYDEAVRDMTVHCYDAAISAAPRDDAVMTLATGILHYVLTNALIGSQRRVEVGGTPVDIVVPDVKTLRKDAARSLVICMGTSDPGFNAERISMMEGIQPVTGNIWMVLPEDIPTGKRTFVLSRDGGSFAGMAFEMARFCSQNGGGRLRILGV